MNVQCTSMNVECTYGWAISFLGREIVYLCVCARVRVHVLVYICACVCVWRSFSFVLSVLSVWHILVVHSKINYIIFHWHHLEPTYLFTHRWTGKGTNSCKCYTARMVSITIAALPALGMLAHRDIRLRSPVTPTHESHHTHWFNPNRTAVSCSCTHLLDEGVISHTLLSRVTHTNALHVTVQRLGELTETYI